MFFVRRLANERHTELRSEKGRLRRQIISGAEQLYSIAKAMRAGRSKVRRHPPRQNAFVELPASPNLEVSAKPEPTLVVEESLLQNFEPPRGL